jgi:hypothetical protein
MAELKPGLMAQRGGRMQPLEFAGNWTIDVHMPFARFAYTKMSQFLSEQQPENRLNPPRFAG